MKLPKIYEWVLDEEGPLMIKEAMKEYGTLESPGTKNNPKIIAWAKEVGAPVSNVYKADSIPWCGLFMAVVAKRANKKPPKDPLWALNWGSFGKYVEHPAFGDVLVFTRKTSDGKTAGHVGLYIAESKTHFHVLAGNQSDAVTITTILKSRIYTSRRPLYINQPKNVRRYYIAGDNSFSKED